MNVSRRVVSLLVCGLCMTASIAAAQTAVDPEAKPFIGSWQGKAFGGLPEPRLRIRKDGTGAYHLGPSDSPLYEFKWKMGEDQLQAEVTDGERFFAGIIRPNGKLVWTQVKLRPGVKDSGLEFEKAPSEF